MSTSDEVRVRWRLELVTAMTLGPAGILGAGRAIWWRAACWRGRSRSTARSPEGRQCSDSGTNDEDIRRTAPERRLPEKKKKMWFRNRVAENTFITYLDQRGCHPVHEAVRKPAGLLSALVFDHGLRAPEVVLEGAASKQPVMRQSRNK